MAKAKGKRPPKTTGYKMERGGRTRVPNMTSIGRGRAMSDTGDRYYRTNAAGTKVLGTISASLLNATEKGRARQLRANRKAKR